MLDSISEAEEPTKVSQTEPNSGFGDAEEDDAEEGDVATEADVALAYRSALQQPPQSPQLPSVFDLASDPSMPVAPHRGENGADPLNESELIHQVVRALRIAVEKFPDSCRVEASSAAFHAEPLLRRLCEEFEDPVRSVAISADNFVVVRVKATDASKFKPRFVIGPLGEGAFHLARDGFSTSGLVEFYHEHPLTESMIQSLTKIGVRRRGGA